MGLRGYIYGHSKVQFVSTWQTDNTSSGSSTTTQIKLPLISAGTYNMTVDWGDGNFDTITTWNQAQVTHTYSSIGTYQIKIKGICTGWQFNNTGDRLKILSVQQWGKLKLGTNQGSYFYGCANLNLSAVEDVLNLIGVTSFANAFSGATSLTTVNRMNEWNVSGVTDFAGMFQSATSFNQNIGSWNMSSSTSLASMFKFASTFNQDIGNWDVSKCLNFTNMFYQAKAFNNGGNDSIKNWTFNTVSTISSAQMFDGDGINMAFNQPIGSWNISKFNSLSAFFRRCVSFNQDLTWDTSNVTACNSAFQDATVFNKNISSWNVSNVTTFNSMFLNAPNFNNGSASGISGTMNWTINTSASVNMGSMFNLASAFNQDISPWNTSQVTNMSSMFSSAGKFNQNIGSWNVSNVTNFSNFMNGKTAATFSSVNLDAIYNGWSSRPVKTPITITFGSAKYTSASSAGRAILTGAPNNWVITDGGI